MSDALLLTELLSAWCTSPQLAEVEQFRAPHYRRLAGALADVGRAPTRVGVGDLAGLIRTVLMHEGSRGGGATHMIVPACPPFPSETEWSEFGLRVDGRLRGGMKVRVESWRPSWLDLQGATSVDERAYERRVLRIESRVPTDPAIRELVGEQFGTYRSPGQAMAVRVAFLIGAGKTLLVNLPTGQGKSLVFQSFARWAERRGRLSVIVVPTTALAKDHERRFADLGWLSCPVAYHGGLSPEEKTDFKKRIRAGTQGVVVTSPESLLGPLRTPLIERAEAGTVAQFVVDEAHMLEQWGAEFRPTYQFLPAFRDLLVERSPEGTAPRTLLLSATVTETALETLERLFGPIEQVSAVHLRPEPEYWIKAAATDGEKERFVREAITRLPRPFILYTTTREAAEQYRDVVRELGICRTELVMGGASRLDEILLAWERRETDIVVATSAFGLGVDNNEVRAVLHACVPETVDRFYQEVGRAGRDGRAAISLTVSSPPDWITAHGLGSKRLITPEKGWPRWSQMWQTKKGGDDGRFRLDLSSVRRGLEGPGEENRKWNERTLSLMARAGLIRLRTPVPELPGDIDWDSPAFQRALEDAFAEVQVEIRDATALNDQDKWTQLVGRERGSAKGKAEKDFDRLKAALSGGTEMNEVLAETYSIDGVEVERGPGRCPATRRAGTASTLHPLPCPSAPSVATVTIENVLVKRMGATYVTYDRRTPSWKESVRMVVEAASRLGFIDFVLPASFLKEPWTGRLHRGTGFSIVRDLDDAQCPERRASASDLEVPRVVLVPPGRRSDQVPQVYLFPHSSGVPGTARLILFEKSMEVPDQPGWLFADQVTVLTDCQRFMEILNSGDS